uniref:Uncharacterized protein n=1 Tax=Octopus bimaculoides TaxID=37653 RepID=A0A0L8FS58_OCTBM
MAVGGRYLLCLQILLLVEDRCDVSWSAESMVVNDRPGTAGTIVKVDHVTDVILVQDRVIFSL